MAQDARNLRYAKLRIAKKKLGLDDDVYRDRLERETGKRSAREMSLAEMDRVLEQFRKDGFKARPASHKPQVRKVFAMWRAMGSKLACGGSLKGLFAFVKKMVGVDDPNFMTEGQAGVVIEALKAWEKRL